MYACFMIGTVVILVTMLVAMLRTKELKPSAELLAEIDAAPKGLGAAVKDIAERGQDMPVAMHKIGVAFLFQWYAMFIYWQFVAVSLGESIFNGGPGDRRRGVGPGDLVERPGERHLQPRHDDRRSVPRRLVPEDRGQAGARALPRLPRPSRWSGCPTSATSTSPSSP